MEEERQEAMRLREESRLRELEEERRQIELMKAKKKAELDVRSRSYPSVI